MLYAEKTLAEIAGMDDLQCRAVYFRPRSSTGKLIRGGGLPPGVHVDEDGMRVVKNPVAFSEMYKQVGERQGLPPEKIEAGWQQYLAENPKLGKGGEEFG